MITADDILGFWFGEDLESPAAVAARSRLWFAGGAEFDEQVRERFGDLPDLALRGGLDDWRTTPRPALALTLALDQFPRNLYRGTPRAFAFDAAALRVATQMIERGFDLQLPPLQAVFAYLPLEHAEDLDMQNRCVDLFEKLLQRAPAELQSRFRGFLDYAIRHRDVIEQFGRFPHRNAVLGRPSTTAEALHLESGGDAF